MQKILGLKQDLHYHTARIPLKDLVKDGLLDSMQPQRYTPQIKHIPDHRQLRPMLCYCLSMYFAPDGSVICGNGNVCLRLRSCIESRPYAGDRSTRPASPIDTRSYERSFFTPYQRGNIPYEKLAVFQWFMFADPLKS
jgi:hypothetical protein